MELRNLLFLDAADEMWFDTADVRLSLDHPANRAIMPGADWDLTVFSYVLAENAQGVRDNDFAMLRGLFAVMRPGACCMVLDASEKLHDDLLNLAQRYGLEASQCIRPHMAGRSALPRNCIIITNSTKPAPMQISSASIGCLVTPGVEASEVKDQPVWLDVSATVPLAAEVPVVAAAAAVHLKSSVAQFAST